MSGYRWNLVYPERRVVSEDTIETWYSDALANGEVEPTPTEPSVFEKAAALDDSGIITISGLPWKD